MFRERAERESGTTRGLADITRDLILGHGLSADGDFEIRVYGVGYLDRILPD